MRFIFLLFLTSLVLFTSCTSTQQNIKNELERECGCSRVEMTEEKGPGIPYVTYSMVNPKTTQYVKESSRLFFHLIEHVSGFCELDKKIVLKYVDTKGSELASYVYHKCQIQFEF
ncbi:MAG: hypothetical protein ACHQF2_03815 [Flavobacteriales bacterium]